MADAGTHVQIVRFRPGPEPPGSSPLDRRRVPTPARAEADVTAGGYAGGMRGAGVVTDVRGRGPHDHLCWAYDDPASYDRHAAMFLAEGLAAGQRIWLMTGRGGDTAAEIIPGFAGAIRDGAAEVMSMTDLYPADGLVDPEALTDGYAAATDLALADGFSGLRIAGDGTHFLTGPAQVDAFVRFEHLVDRLMIERPFAAVCGFDRGRVDDATLTAVAAVHPLVNADLTPVRVYAGDGYRVLAGELDWASRDTFPTLLARTDTAAAGRVILDVSELRFVDHRSLLAIEAYAYTYDRRVVLRGGRPPLLRLLDLLTVDRIQAEVAA
jgi:MEDS: MEthanogen/methylotroph, DcmR Sensory domain/STAS domain